MDNTPKSFQNSSESGCYFEISHSLFESTPNTKNESTPVSTLGSRKRKASCLERRNLADVIESPCSDSPQFSSTLNDSLTRNLEKVHLESLERQECDQRGHKTKLFKNNDNAAIKIRSAPSTPEKQMKATRELGKRANTNSFIKHFSQFNVQSPLNREAYEILYPDLPSLERQRKPLTPQKFKENLEKNVTPAKKCLFTISHRELFRKVCTNNIVMSNIFIYLSDGDLYRLSMVSKTLYDALMMDTKASDRYQRFLHQYKSSKENYRITPPKSPEKGDNAVEASPDSKNFYYFCTIASKLNKNQSLVKCPRCDKASIVENHIAQCQDVNSCGYICCLKCNSFANNPKDFKDKCNNAQLGSIRPRSRLGDLSNSTVTSDYATDYGSSSFLTSSSFNLSTSNKYDSSGFFSEGEPTTPKLTVRRNLSKSFTSPFEVKPKALSSNNRILLQQSRVHRRTSLLPVIQPTNATTTAEIIEPSSPPKVKMYSACSKQSKRNLKRLTR